MSPLRIGIDARIVPGAFGGVEQFTLGLIHAVTHLDDGDEAYVLLVNPGQVDWLAPYVGPRGRIVEAAAGLGGPLPPGASALARLRRRLSQRLPAVRDAWWRVRGAVRGADPQLVPRSDGTLEDAGVELVHFPMQSGFLTSLPSIYQPWDLQHLHLPAFFSADAIRSREARYRALCDQARVVVVASEWTRNDLVKQYGLARSKVDVVPVPPVLEFYPVPDAADLATARRKFGLPEAFLYYPAQAWPHKNHPRLLRALAEVGRAIDAPIPLVCSGSPNEDSPKVAAEARRLGLADSVLQVGYVSPLDVQCLYRLARGMVFPSLFEGWGMPILEAYAAETPVACSDAASLREAAGEGALLFDPFDEGAMEAAIRTLWLDDAARQRLIAAGKRHLQSVNWEATARVYREIYRDLVR